MQILIYTLRDIGIGIEDTTRETHYNNAFLITCETRNAVKKNMELSDNAFLIKRYCK